MKPFNLQEALAGKPVVTRQGDPVTQLHKFDVQGHFSVAGVLSGAVQNWTEQGKLYTNQEHGYDLFMASEKRTEWIVLWKLSERIWGDYAPVIAEGPFKGKPVDLTGREVKVGEVRQTHSGQTKKCAAVLPIEWEE